MNTNRITATLTTPAGNLATINLVDRIAVLTSLLDDSDGSRLSPGRVAERLAGAHFNSDDALAAAVLVFVQTDGPWWVPSAEMAEHERCPHCGSPHPALHPTEAAYPGVIHVCGDGWHTSTFDGRAVLRASGVTPSRGAMPDSGRYANPADQR